MWTEVTSLNNILPKSKKLASQMHWMYSQCLGSVFDCWPPRCQHSCRAALSWGPGLWVTLLQTERSLSKQQGHADSLKMQKIPWQRPQSRCRQKGPRSIPLNSGQKMTFAMINEERKEISPGAQDLGGKQSRGGVQDVQKARSRTEWLALKEVGGEAGEGGQNTRSWEEWCSWTVFSWRYA